MKYFPIQLALFSVLTLLVNQVSALPDSSAPPSMMDMSSKYAKNRAKLRAYQVDYRSSGTDADIFAVGDLGTSGCNLNVGNVVLDNTTGVPNDITVFVQGDIIQSNNCR
ncbi:hypothetical protein [Thiothrix lacustris]|uniref:hypothetical protein n=1 Tax=Thiothrix lacustris TaxID=525917 RepID=UPI0027E41FB2|nr:hypothetical protein [Thiothrix lacustris]WMP16336.1 hypothetical protein RCS87_13175 [Thiothrix lacustris]